MERLPIYISYERSVLGAVFIDPDLWNQVTDVLAASDFEHSLHMAVFSCLAELADKSIRFDPMIVAELIGGENNKSEIAEYMVSMIDSVPVVANIDEYVQTLKKYSDKRRILVAAEKLKQSVNDWDANTDELLAEFEEATAQIGEKKSSNVHSFDEIMPGLLDKIDQVRLSGSTLTGLATGFADLDSRMGGLQAGDMIVVGARPSMGKTSFLMGIAENVIVRGGEGVVVIFSLEMPGEQLVMRALSSGAQIEQKKIRTGKASVKEWQKVLHTAKTLKGGRLLIDDTGSQTPQAMKKALLRIQRTYGKIAMVGIDYLQLMDCSDKSDGGNRTQEMTRISRSIKRMAKEFNCPMVALSQLNRGLEQRPNKRPINSDLRESGAIEQDADVILFLYRDEVYNEHSEAAGIAELIIGKQRNGPIGTVKLSFSSQFTRFDNLAR